MKVNMCAHICVLLYYMYVHMCGEQRTLTTYTPLMPSILCYRTEIFTVFGTWKFLIRLGWFAREYDATSLSPQNILSCWLFFSPTIVSGVLRSSPYFWKAGTL